MYLLLSLWDLIISQRNELRTHEFFNFFYKLNFFISKKSISRNGYVMKGEAKLLTNFKWIFKMSIPMVEMLKNKIVKTEPANKVQSFFIERDAFSARKTSLFISFTSLIRME